MAIRKYKIFIFDLKHKKLILLTKKIRICLKINKFVELLGSDDSNLVSFIKIDFIAFTYPNHYLLRGKSPNT